MWVCKRSEILCGVLGSRCSTKSNELVGTSRKLHCNVCVCGGACTCTPLHDASWLFECLSACPFGALNEQTYSANQGQGHGRD